MKKIIYILVSVSIALLLMFDTISKQLIQVYVKNQINTDVVIGEFRSSLTDKTINIDFIEIKNPQPYNADDVISINHLFLLFSNSTTAELLVIEDLRIDGVYINLEQNKKGINMLDILRSLERNTLSDDDQVKSTSTPNGNSDSANKIRVAINKIEFSDMEITIDTNWTSEKIKLPDTVIRGFGGRQGVPYNLVGSEIYRIVLSNIQEEMSDIGIDLTKDQIKKGIRRQLQGELDMIKDNLSNKAKNFLQNLGI